MCGWYSKDEVIFWFMYSPQVDEMPMPEIWYSPVFGMGFWINDIGLLMSAPAFCTAGDYDMDNAIPVSDWENWEEINTPENLSCLADIVQVCTLKRDFANIRYYSRKFSPVG